MKLIGTGVLFRKQKQFPKNNRKIKKSLLREYSIEAIF